jgi:hypothetical protein
MDERLLILLDIACQHGSPYFLSRYIKHKNVNPHNQHNWKSCHSIQKRKSGGYLTAHYNTTYKWTEHTSHLTTK